MITVNITHSLRVLDDSCLIFYKGISRIHLHFFLIGNRRSKQSSSSSAIWDWCAPWHESTGLSLADVESEHIQNR